MMPPNSNIRHTKVGYPEGASPTTRVSINTTTRYTIAAREAMMPKKNTIRNGMVEKDKIPPRP